MIYQKIFEQIQHHFETVIARDSDLGNKLWAELLEIHPADIAQFLSSLDRAMQEALFVALPASLQLEVFGYLTDQGKAFCLFVLPDQEKINLLENTSFDELADLFDLLSDDELKELFKLLRKKDRERVLELMKFGPESAGGIMDTNVFSLVQDFTVEKSIQILQRLQPSQELHQEIYVTDQANRLVGHIKLEDLVLKNPKTTVSSFMRSNELVVDVQEDQEEIAKKMVHYHLMSVPVVGKEGYFVGVIPSDTLVDIIEEEASEDIYRISAMTPLKTTYFETSFRRLVGERSVILVILLLIESITSTVIDSFEETLSVFSLAAFIPMLVNCGGATSSQTSVLAVQGLTSGEINYSNIKRFLRREFFISLALAVILGVVAFTRVYVKRHDVAISASVGLSLMAIVAFSVTLGSMLPLLLKRLNIDPASSAGPFLGTIMDILGTLMFCYISKVILG